ncbi:hypothetical protein TrLO_g9147 [Triparma laevis f. longispina]|uniref:Uncharacterized protein n=2 Tax=Triparma laevis TaxID=1534972 RepID=A0A9W6ZX07_9STRA|nr:hypothetical protein TrLO_g9147 [Triparma laevis f. longispina]
MSEYEQMCFKRIARTKHTLKASASPKTVNPTPKCKPTLTKPKPATKTRKSIPKQHVRTGEERRFSRVKKDISLLVELSNKWDETTGGFVLTVREQDVYEEGDVTYYHQSTRVKSSTVNINVKEYTLSEADKKKLAATCDENYPNKLAEFPTHHNSCSDRNVRTVMKQAEKLYNGKGCYYKHWDGRGGLPIAPDDRTFMKNVRIKPLTDIVEVLLEAKAWENKYGRDLGNGWLLDHPSKKMLLFQQFCLNNPGFMTSDLKNGAWNVEDDAESTEEDNEEDIENLPVYQSQGRLKGNLTTLLESVGTNVSTAVSPSKASRKSPSKSPRKSPAKKSRSTSIKSPKKGESLPSFVVKQKTTEKKKSALDLLKEKVAAKKAAKSTEVSTTTTSSPKKSAKELMKAKVTAKKSATVKTKTKTVVKKVTPPAKKASTTTPKKKSVKEQLTKKLPPRNPPPP